MDSFESLFMFMCIAHNPKRNNINIFHFSLGLTQVRVLYLKNKGKILFCWQWQLTDWQQADSDKKIKTTMNRDCSNHQKFKNCPPKDIFKKFEKKADNHSTLVITAFLFIIKSQNSCFFNQILQSFSFLTLLKLFLNLT